MVLLDFGWRIGDQERTKEQRERRGENCDLRERGRVCE